MYGYVEICDEARVLGDLLRHYVWSFRREENLFGSWEGSLYQEEFLHLTCMCTSGDEFFVGIFLL